MGQTAPKTPSATTHSLFTTAYLREKQRADERTRTADLTSLRVIIQALQRLAQGSRTRISKRVSFLRLATRCTVLRSRWCQSGVRSMWITRRRLFCKPDPPQGRV